MKNRALYSILIFISVVFISACGSKQQDQNSENIPETAGTTSEFHTEDEVIAGEVPETAEGIEKTDVEDSWVNHYYNRGIYFKDGYTYRQFADGLYRRQAGTDSWEMLCDIPMNYGPGLTCYGDRLYFSGYQEDADIQGSGWNNTVFYYDLDTGEQGELLPVESLVGVLSVYKDCLYVQNFAADGGYQIYDGYRLDGDGNILEKLDSDGEDFICREQNEYSLAEYQEMSGAASGRRGSDTDFRELKNEVIPIPACAAMLGGKAVLSQYKDESSVSIFLRDVDSGEDRFLFDAEPVLLVTGDGIYYRTVYDDNFKFYSFKEQKSIELGIDISTEDIPAYSSTYFTYDENAFYYYDINSDTKRIVRISRDDWSEETIAEGDILDSEAGWRINQVDEEYFYHGDQMYPIS